MKRLMSIVTLVLLFSFYVGTASAIEAEVYSSLTLSGYSASLSRGKSTGTVNVNYTVRSSKAADSIGVSSIVIYTSDDEYVTTITGTTRNGLIRENSSIYSDKYSCKLTSGTAYYAEVTVFATVGETSDQRVITTNTVTAP